ncbi:hypothetical protein NLX83_27880 [Allokutzneria sp. A3M-2-11 16]|uniref:hypothetical protein n=1 Tax=Allokutzneria sp. A3M-2-11 16 TaxID=2962043 RepID=UPI0020B840A2|nr:hypothetical protein [Allokutzneria sp. A3M-2-11 16]MCP3803102.1 hypothetical protein [Allokutzneria sp. A3M-2-11 16]
MRGQGGPEELHSATEQLCCDYAWKDPHLLSKEANRLLVRADGEQAGWLHLLLGCVHYDLRHREQAEAHRRAAFRLGQEVNNGEIVAWSFEMSAWFALTQGRLDEVAAYAEAGKRAAPNSSVAVQLCAQAAKAAARMGETGDLRKILDEGYRLLGQHQNPERPENHFVVEPGKWDSYALDCFTVVGEDKLAEEHAREVLKTAAKSPMRASEAHLALATVALRRGDIEGAAEWVHTALAAPRKSLDHLGMLTAELVREVHERYPGDPAARLITEPIEHR